MNKILPLSFLLLVTFLMSSCAVVGGIFKAGVWVGILLVLIVIGFIIWLVTRAGGRS